MVFIIPRPDGQAVLSITPVEFLDRLTALVPPPISPARSSPEDLAFDWDQTR